MTKKVILATSPWCGSCEILKNQLNGLNATYETKDMIDDPTFFKEHGIRNVPTLVVEETQITGASNILNYFKS